MDRKKICIAIISLVVIITFTLRAQTLSGVDDLGRILPQQDAVGNLKSGKHVGMFYFLWQGDKHSPTSENVWDLHELHKRAPEVFLDFNHPGWGGGAGTTGRYYFWGESIYGYYRGDDYWVHLKNIQLLTDAGVDFLVIDATNRLTYPEQSHVLMQVIAHVHNQGKPAPKLVYYTNTASGESMQEIYNNYYKEGAPYRYPNCWYYLDGKPLIIGISEEAKNKDYASFFTIRESQWPNEPKKINGWPWIEFHRPQKVYKNHRGEKEIVNVSAAQHPNLDASMGGSAFYDKSGNWGRSFRNGKPGNSDKDILYGYNIQEQWDFALKQDVPFVFVTGWNEWIAGKWKRVNGNLNEAHFVDQADPEYSRDIEPAWSAELRDNYYMQLIANIRRYKGYDVIPSLKFEEEVKGLDDWDEIPTLYQDYLGDVEHRNHLGAQTIPITKYKNNTGRNDISSIKIAKGSSKLYFYVDVKDKLTPRTGDNWMTLWLNTDESYSTGWFGYDFRVVNGNKLQKFHSGFWIDVSEVDCQKNDNQLMISIPYPYIGIPSSEVLLEFKWSDNMQKQDPIDWYINGDVAPGGRLNLIVRL